MKPQRSPAHLAFIRSLPCCVSGRRHGVEAAHVGRRGMGQKCSDFETIPLNSLYHREQHRIGLKRFARTYELDIAALLAMLNRKPQMHIDINLDRWAAFYGDDLLILGDVSQGLQHSIKLLKDRVREILTNEILRRVEAFS